MRFAQIRKSDISNGLGYGISLFTQGCNFHCPGCHNYEQWNLNDGEEYTTAQEQLIIKLAQPEYVKRFSVLGGEPLMTRNLKELLILFEKLKESKPDIKIWIYTGNTYEELQERIKNNPEDYYLDPILKIADVLVDGKFIQEQKDLTLNFRGSRNQRVIDLRQTAKIGSVVLLDI